MLPCTPITGMEKERKKQMRCKRAGLCFCSSADSPAMEATLSSGRVKNSSSPSRVFSNPHATKIYGIVAVHQNASQQGSMRMTLEYLESFEGGPMEKAGRKERTT